jgi:hypothetical protein
MKKHVLALLIIGLVLIIVACKEVVLPALESETPKSPIAEEPKAVAQKDIDLSTIVDLESNRVYSVVAADFNKDGADDIVTGVFNDYSNIFLNNKDDTFEKQPLVNKPYTTQAVAVIDIDGDGSKDLVLGNNQQPIVLLKNNGDGTFSLDQELDRTVVNDIVVADFDNDGKQDFAIATQFKENAVYFNDGGVFTKVVLSENLPAKAIQAADLNNDGRIDIVLGLDHRMSKAILNEGTRTFVLHAELEGEFHTYALALLDATDDGRIDIIEGNNKEQNMLFTNTESGFTGIPIFGSGNTYALIAADFNGDSIKEVVVGNYEQSIEIYERSGDGYSIAQEITAPFRDFVRDFAVGDFNSDGYNDLVVGREKEATQIYLS